MTCSAPRCRRESEVIVKDKEYCDPCWEKYCDDSIKAWEKLQKEKAKAEKKKAK